MPICSVNVWASRSSAALEAEVVERLRTELDREPAYVLQRRHDELAQLGGGGVALLLVLGLLDGLQPEQDRRQRLPRLVVQLAREPPPLELLRLDHAPQRVALHAFGELDGGRRANRETFGKAQVLVGEARIGDRACRARRSRRRRGRARSAAPTFPT